MAWGIFQSRVSCHFCDENCSIDKITGVDGLDYWSKGVLCACLGLMGLMVGPKLCCVFVAVMVVLYIGILWVQ
jgi:hypothetical protein